MTSSEGRPETRPEGDAPAIVDPTTSLAGHTFAYGLSGILVPLVGLVTLPVYARALTPAQYGVLELALAATVVALVLTDAGLISAAQRSYYDYRDEERERRHSVVLTAFVATTTFAFAIAAALLASRTGVSQALFGTADEANLIVLVAASLVPMNTARFLTETMRIRFQAMHFLIAAGITAIVSGAAGIVGVVAFDGGPESIVLGIAIGSGAAAIYGFVVVRDSLHGRVWGFELRRMMRYGIPLIPSGLAAWALAFADRIILANLKDLQEVGEYAVASRLSLVLIIGSTGFLLALWPLLLSTYSENPEQERATRGRTLTYLTFVLCCGALILTLSARGLLTVVAPGYDDAYKAVGPLTLGGVAYALSTLLMTGILISRRTIHLAAFALLAAGVNVALNFALIPAFGFVGSAIGTAIGYGVLAVAYYRVAQRLYPTPYEPTKVSWTVAAAAAFSLVGLVSLDSLPLEIVLKLAGFGGFLAVVWASGAIRRAELAELRRFGRAMVPQFRAAGS